ncbi:MAG: hypothetical protein ACOY9C_13110 [Pseudomonadota bacterium]|uniref:hypothetical protein n=1 Tax=Phenylobacterium zucineum TaxID=284016 RepID=UPI00059BE8ED|nr:hypothetical protein [Phenylobacterium zucineum]
MRFPALPKDPVRHDCGRAGTASRRSGLSGRLIAAALLWAPLAASAAPHEEQPLVVEPARPGVWRADAKGMLIEFQAPFGSQGALSIRFIGQGGESIAPPPARQVSLTSSGGPAVSFSPSAGGWTSTTQAPAPQDGALLSIIEADHRHDFRLNVHAKPDSTQPTERTP